MAFTVEFSLRAERDIDEIVLYIQADSPHDATRWRQRLHEKLQALRTLPEACGIAPENAEARCEIRQLIYGRYRVLFTIREKSVFIVTVRHGARRFMADNELREISDPE